MPASQRFHHGEQGNQIYLGDREALPSLTLHYVQRAAVQGASLLPSIIFGGSSAPQILRSGLLGRTFNRDCSWHQGLAYKNRSLYRSKKFFKNGLNNSEKFTSSVKIIVMTSSRAGIKKTPTGGAGTRESRASLVHGLLQLHCRHCKRPIYSHD